MLAAGFPKSASHIARRFFRGEPTRQTLHPVPVHRLNKELRQWATRVDLVYAHVDRITARVFDPEYLTLPGSLSLLTTLPDTLTQLNRLNRNVREDVRRIRENSLHYEISRGRGDFDEFYHQFYIPTMKRRHGTYAVIINRHLMRRMMVNGGIIWITHEDRRVAGCAIQRYRNILNFVGTGVKEGGPDLVRLGALTAVYYFGSRYAMEQGCKHVEFGSTAPYLGDGLLQYKQKWRPHVSMAQAAHCIRMYWPQLNEAVIGFLASSSPIFVDGDRLSAITALRSLGPADDDRALQLFSRQTVLELKRFWVVSQAGWQFTETSRMVDGTELKMVQNFGPRHLAREPANVCA